MGFRFQKRLSLMRGVRVNLSKSGASLSLGQRGASVTIGKNGVMGNAGIPGTGLSYREKLSGKSSWVLIALAVAGVAFGGSSPQKVLENLLSILNP